MVENENKCLNLSDMKFLKRLRDKITSSKYTAKITAATSKGNLLNKLGGEDIAKATQNIESVKEQTGRIGDTKDAIEEFPDKAAGVATEKATGYAEKKVSGLTGRLQIIPKLIKLKSDITQVLKTVAKCREELETLARLAKKAASSNSGSQILDRVGKQAGIDLGDKVSSNKLSNINPLE